MCSHHLFTVTQLIKELLWLTNYTCDSIETAGKSLHIQVLLSTTTAERQNKKKTSSVWMKRREERLQSERHNYRAGLHPARLSARLRNGPPEPSGTDELAGSPGADLAPPPALRPLGVRGRRDTSIHPSAAVYSHRAADVGDGEATATRRLQHVFSRHPEIHPSATAPSTSSPAPSAYRKSRSRSLITTEASPPQT